MIAFTNDFSLSTTTYYHLFQRRNLKIKTKKRIPYLIWRSITCISFDCLGHGGEWNGSMWDQSGVGIWINTIACGHGFFLKLWKYMLMSNPNDELEELNLLSLGFMIDIFWVTVHKQESTYCEIGNDLTLHQGDFEHDRVNGLKFTSDCHMLVFLYWCIVHRFS